MKRLLTGLSVIALAAVAIAPTAHAVELNPDTELSPRFKQARINNLNSLSERFEEERRATLDE